MHLSRIQPTTRGRRVAALLCALVVAASTASCGGNPEDGASDTALGTPQDVAQVPVEEDTTAPEAEEPGATEAPVDTGNHPVAVELPGLPIGGDAIVVSDTLQCVDVGWTEPPTLPDRVSIAVTGVALTPSDGFALSDEPCEGGAQACLDGGFELARGDRCYVAVTWTGPTLDSDRTLSFTSGRILCAPDHVARCTAFRDEVAAAGPQSIGLEPAPSELSELSEPAAPAAPSGSSGTSEPAGPSGPSEPDADGSGAGDGAGDGAVPSEGSSG